MTGVAIIPRIANHIPYGWIFIVVVIALILLIFIRVYGFGDRSQRAARGSEQRTEHPSGHAPEQPGHKAEHGGSHGHQPGSRRRPNRH